MNQGIFLDQQKFKRSILKLLLNPLLGWQPLTSYASGFSIILGVPWALKHLLPVNLHFLEKTDLNQLNRIHIVFDRVEQQDSEEFLKKIRVNYPKLPLTFRFHPTIAGRIVERINQSKFYASMNWTIGLGQCETRYAILHDFDLYPLAPNYFSSMFEAMLDRNLRFTGLEFTHFDNLEDSHKLIGTWALGIDVAWLRGHFRPIDCFHTVADINGQRFDLDAFTYIESNTQERDLVGTVTEKDMAHVRNLCSTYLRFSKGESFDVVWRLHLMWYLESLCGTPDRLPQLIQIMDRSTSSNLKVDNWTADFSNTHVTCANVLRKEIIPMEKFLFGNARPIVTEYIEAFERYLLKNGRSETLFSKEGLIIWDRIQGKNLIHSSQ